jgi:hypothetical protein
VDGNCRYERAVTKSPEKANSDRKSARQRLPRDEITVTNREAGNENEIDRFSERPALNKTSRQAQGRLNRQNCRQHRPRHVNRMAERHESAAATFSASEGSISQNWMRSVYGGRHDMNRPVVAFVACRNEVTLIDPDALPPFRDRQTILEFAIAPAELRSRVICRPPLHCGTFKPETA